ncbi:MAG: hypothetical protein LBP59_06210 [Planctomycetaceae bacterium]|jgi:hypothetical protein|nr:hypothetical protein [Planctomycetaceae bacterium]
MENKIITSTTNTEKTTNLANKKFGAMGYILAFGLILIFIGILANFVELDKRVANRFLYLFDPRHWTLWLVPVLWGVVFWFIVNALCYFEFIRKRKFWIQSGVIVGLILATPLLMFKLTNWSWNGFLAWSYHNIYLPVVIMPTANYMATGVLSWQFFILPAIGIVAIVVLLITAKKYGRKKS